jgi:DNA-binding NarL/FixJ family response regulator
MTATIMKVYTAPGFQRAVVDLWCSGYLPRQIAEVLGASEINVRVILKRRLPKGTKLT